MIKVEYRIIKKTNLDGKVRFDVQQFWPWLRGIKGEWITKSQDFRTLRRAEREIRHLKRVDARNTWVEEVVG